MNEAFRRLYQDVIVDHHQHPRNEGPLADATHEAIVRNPLCGDEVTVRLIVENERLAEVRFESRGCVLSRASASLMTEKILGQSAKVALAIGRELTAFVSGLPQPGVAELLGVLTALEGVRDFPSRIACVTLPWQALEQALASTSKKA